MIDVREIIESLDGDELCRYCSYKNRGCSGEVKGTPNGPVFPPCSDGLNEEDFDLESYLEDKESEEAECRVCCRPVNDMGGRYYTLGIYRNEERAEDVFNAINKAYYNVPLMDGDGVLYNQSSFCMPEE